MRRSTPVTLGIRMSDSTRSTFCVFMRPIASLPSFASTTSYPSNSRLAARVIRKDSSSSTRRIRIFLPRALGARAMCRYVDDESRSRAGLGFHSNAGSVSFERAAHDREPEPSPLRLRAEQRLEDLRRHVLRHAGTVVLHLDLPVVSKRFSEDLHMAAAPIANRFARILNEVHEDLTELIPVDLRHGECGRHTI